MINVIVNGEERETPENLNLSKLLKHLELPSERVAVELNREVVRRADWEKTEIKNGDKLEIVHFVGGGNLDFRFWIEREIDFEKIDNPKSKI